MVIDDKVLDGLSAQAKDSPRLRMNLNFHQNLDDKCHRFLNAVEPGADIPNPSSSYKGRVFYPAERPGEGDHL